MGLVVTITRYWPLILLALAVLYLFSPPRKKISSEDTLEALLKSKDAQIAYLMEENKQLRSRCENRREASVYGQRET